MIDLDGSKLFIFSSTSAAMLATGLSVIGKPRIVESTTIRRADSRCSISISIRITILSFSLAPSNATQSYLRRVGELAELLRTPTPTLDGVSQWACLSHPERSTRSGSVAVFILYLFYYYCVVVFSIKSEMFICARCDNDIHQRMHGNGLLPNDLFS